MIPVYSWLGPKPVVVRPSYVDSKQSISLLYDSKKHKTDLYDARVCAVRRDTSVALSFVSKHGKFDANTVSLKLVTKVKSSPFAISVSQGGPVVHGFEFHVHKFDTSSLVAHIQVHVNAPIGLYHIQLMVGNTALSEEVSLYVVFNPLSPNDPVHMPDPTMRARHVFAQKTYVFRGTARSHFATAYQLYQFSLEVVLVTSYFCGRCSLDHRADPLLMARDFTALVNSNDDQGLLTGNWSGNYRGGVSPSAWTSVRDICRRYLHGGPVKYGQCWLFAICYEGVCKSCGIPCLSLSMFPSCHDVNKDGKLTTYVYSDDMSTAPGGDFVWNYHCGNEICSDRPDVDCVGVRAPFWQHVDSTPQERSGGVYRCGPYPVKLVWAGAQAHGFEVPYDGDFVSTSINTALEYIVVNRNMVVQRKFVKKHCCDVIVTGGDRGREISLLNRYRQVREKPPSSGPSKMKAHLQVPARVQLTDEIPYTVTIAHAPNNSPTIAALVLELVDQRGRSLLPSKPPIKTFVLTESDINVSGKSQPLEYHDGMDLEHAALRWEFRCIDESTNKLKVVREHTALAPSFSGQIECSSLSRSGPLDVLLTVRNELAQDIKDCHIVIKNKEQMDGVKQQIGVFPARSEQTFNVSVPDLVSGVVKLEFWLHSRLGVLFLAKKKVFVL